MSSRTHNIPIKMQRKTSTVEDINEKIIEMLDEVEKRVEQLRETASIMEQEKESLMEMLSTVEMNKSMLRMGVVVCVCLGEREDVDATLNRLIGRCRTVDVNVSTPRNEEQENALKAVTSQLDTVMERMKGNLDDSKKAVERFLNACSPDDPHGPIDTRFQSSIIACTADDQKKIRRKLNHLMTVIDRAGKTVAPLF